MTLSAEELDELDILIHVSRHLYDDLAEIPREELERRRDVWSRIVEVQDRITVLLPPATNPL